MTFPVSTWHQAGYPGNFVISFIVFFKNYIGRLERGKERELLKLSLGSSSLRQKFDLKGNVAILYINKKVTTKGVRTMVE